jgi:alkylation response protein AidB-like acyl-CoA dehydrogenase
VTTFALPDEIEELRVAALRFAQERLAAPADQRTAEAAHHWPDDVVRVLDGFSLRDLDIPQALGGSGAGCLAKVVLLEALAMGDPGGLLAVDQPGASTGAILACPDPRLAAEAVRAALDGTVHTALVVADPDTEHVPRIDWAPAWPPLRSAWVTRGDELSLVDVDPPQPVVALAFAASGAVTAELASAPVAQWTLDPGVGIAIRGRARLYAAAIAVGIAQASFDATIAYTTERVVFGKPVAHHQANAFELASLATAVHGSRLAVRDAAMSFDLGDEHAGFWGTQAWVTAIDTAIATTDAGIQLLGGHGFLLDHLAEKKFREARMLGLLYGGRDSAEADVADAVLGVPDSLFT